MKHIAYTLLFFIFLVACQKDEAFNISEGKGTLILENISVQTENINAVSTRAVQNDLYVEVWQNGQLMSGQQYEPGKVPAKLDLPAGSYQLKTYNQAYKEMPNWLDTEIGGAAFYAEKDFKIEVGEINHLNVEVPMVNIGVSLKLPEGFSDRFKTYLFTVQSGDRSVKVINGQTAYLQVSDKIIYTLSVENNDGENKTDSRLIETPEAGTVYEISYAYETKGMIISVNFTSQAE
ncbi:DUF4493 domain-containing protein [uncultured Parabacteroides sp.]|uniref:DUF4493 domain-containing protein n=1 Tax=uncultured Parabacteroides sp. TaxID=512312 RepID=UPI002617C33A|nr:DUF4493 domain-containing protein [uncultured Parabacteroides sp.]